MLFKILNILNNTRLKMSIISNNTILKNNSKKELGQFYTTNYNYILQNLTIPTDISTIIEPFAGKGDLLKYLTKDYTIESYDIDPKDEIIIKRDTLLEPPIFKNKFILTNPPYLARNKSKSKIIYDKYNENDLYKCFIRELLKNQAIGGIIIIPLNFFCSIRKKDVNLRRDFLKIYNIKQLNIFEEQVFEDTKYTICSFLFMKEDYSGLINTTIYPINKNIILKINKDNKYQIGGELYQSKKSPYKIERLTKKNKTNPNITNILLKCIDDSLEKKIQLSYNEEHYVDNTEKSSARSYATLIITPKLSKEQQLKLIETFNSLLNTKREEYHSLFLTNYRESKKIARKRISFTLAFNIILNLLTDKIF